MKNKIWLLTITSSLVLLSSIANAEPYSTWKNQHEHQGSNFKMEHAQQEPLPYSGLVNQYYNGNDTQVQMKVALAFEKGLFNTPKNLDEAANWYNKAALNGSSEAGFKLYEYSRIKNNGKPTEAGMDWLKWSASEGDANALYKMGDYYSENMKASDENLRNAIEFYSRAEDKGHPYAYKQIKSIKKELNKRETKKSWNSFWAPFKPSEY